jgi:predicted secreted protein
MRDSREVQELEAQISLDTQRFDEVERLRAELIENIPPRGFSAVSTELRYRSEEEGLETSIREGKEMLAGVRAHPEQHILRRETNANDSDIAVAAYYIWLRRKDQTDNFSRSQTAEMDWAQATRNLRLRV